MPFGFRKGGRGRGFRGGRGPGGFRPGRPPTNCICPNCGAIVPHRPGLPCFQTRCARCDTPMTRQFFPEGQET